MCLFFLLIGGVVFVLVGRMEQVQSDTSIVIIDKKESKTIVFYKDDCPHCQSVFPWLYFHNLRYNDLLFVNLNQPKNREYIQPYKIKSVPTLVRGNAHYSGTNIKELQKFIAH